MRKIKLTKGMSTIVDDSDFEFLSKFKWCTANNGYDNFYAVAWDGKKMIRMHRVLLNVTDRNVHVDHINGDTLDNRRENLRICSNSENRRNAKLCKRNSTGFKGVRTRSNIKVFQSYITYNNKFYHLGYFKTAEDAARAYDRKARELHGEFARLNFPDET